MVKFVSLLSLCTVLTTAITTTNLSSSLSSYGQSYKRQISLQKSFAITQQLEHYFYGKSIS